ncbi:MAG: c-type cytochrome [Synechococcales bacterium]|nr:c-type cytochrome [Synechococcales bacterium]
MGWKLGGDLGEATGRDSGGKRSRWDFWQGRLKGFLMGVIMTCSLLLYALPSGATDRLPPDRLPIDRPSADSIPSSQSVDLLQVDLAKGAQVFEAQCAGCHGGGGNIVRRGKNLKLKALQRNHVDTIATIAQLVQTGQGNMSAYRDRLSPTEINQVAAYVLDQAQKGWK